MASITLVLIALIGAALYAFATSVISAFPLPRRLGVHPPTAPRHSPPHGSAGRSRARERLLVAGLALGLAMTVGRSLNDGAQRPLALGALLTTIVLPPVSVRPQRFKGPRADEPAG